MALLGFQPKLPAVSLFLYIPLCGRDLSKLPAAERAAEEAKIIAYSRLVAGMAAGLTGGDVNVAADAAKTAV